MTMTQDEILAALREVVAENQQYTTWTVSTPHLVALVNLAVEKEREACATQRPWVGLTDGDRNFCSRCGKRTADLTTIHTCTPPQEAIYGMNQDDWKDVVAAISKVRDGRGIYLACRPADVFKDWFLALGTAKLKDKNT